MSPRLLNDLFKAFPGAEHRSSVIHNIVSPEYFDEQTPKGLVFQIICNRLGSADAFRPISTAFDSDHKRNQREDFNYLLMVLHAGTTQESHAFIECVGTSQIFSMPRLKLVVVGSAGWDSAPILESFKPWAERGDLFYLSNVPSAELRALYKHAAATICPSVAEGFDYTGVEAMRSGGIVVSSDIPVHREIYGGASEYFSPYSTEDASMVIRRAFSQDGGAVRERLRTEALQVAEKYTSPNILPKWSQLFEMPKPTQ
ncbi:MAG: glycosyltransferase [Chloroflexi bacterium]|nr:glycosyltransferase [Chloroflexota bacterium]